MVLFPDFLPVCHPLKKNDEPWLSEADHRTGWNKEFKNGTHRGLLYGIVCAIIRNKSNHWPSQRVCQRTCGIFVLGRTDITALTLTASTVERKNRRAGICWFVPRSMQGFFSQRF